MVAHLSLPVVVAVQPLHSVFSFPRCYSLAHASLASDDGIRAVDAQVGLEAICIQALGLCQRNPPLSPLERFEQLKAALANAIVDDGQQLTSTELATDLVRHLFKAIGK